MCYAIPGIVKGFDGKLVIVDYFGEEKKAKNELDNLQIGDYIYAQGGFAIQKISKEEAESILAVWRETFFDLQEVDLELSHLDLAEQNADSEAAKILDNINKGFKVKKSDLIQLLDIKDPTELELLYKNANFLRQKYHKNACCVHGIIEISNMCSRNCGYCGISTHNNSLKRYKMTKEQIFEAAQEAVQAYGFKALVLQSGEGCGYEIEDLAEVIKRIRKELEALVFISFGEMTKAELETLYEAGARGILLRFETSNEKLYEELHPGYRLKDRIAAIKNASEIGYLIATGALVGVPNQTSDDILNDIQLAKELKTEMYSFGPFIPSKNTPLSDRKSVAENEMLKVLAVMRLVDPEYGNILVTTAFETLTPNARKNGLMAGANSLMLNVTPIDYRKLYSIYPDRAHEEEEIQSQIDDTIAILRSLGRSPTDLSVAIRQK